MAERSLVMKLIADADGDVQKLADSFIKAGIHEDPLLAGEEASVWITGIGDVLPPGSPLAGDE